MKRGKGVALLLAWCVLTGCAPTDTPLWAYLTDGQKEFLNQTQEELPAALIFHHYVETAASYKTTDEKIISGCLQALRKTTVVSKASIASTDSRILEFEMADGDTCSFRFDERRFQGVDRNYYVLSGDDELWKLEWEIRAADSEY